MEGRFPSAILMVGDSFLIEERLKTLFAELRSKIQGELFIQSYPCAESPLEEILGAARTLPFLASFQVFRLRDAPCLKDKKIEIMADYLANPSATTLLVFEAPELNKDHALVALISKSGQVTFLDVAEKRSVGSRFVREKFRRSGKTPAPGVLERRP